MWTLIPGVPIGCRSPRKRGPYSMPIHNEGSESGSDNDPFSFALSEAEFLEILFADLDLPFGYGHGQWDGDHCEGRAALDPCFDYGVRRRGHAADFHEDFFRFFVPAL